MLKTRGIVLRTVKYGETSVITDIFTEAQGLHTFIAGGVRSARSKMPYSLFQPMSVVEIMAYFRNAADPMHRLKEARNAEVFSAIPFDLRKGAVALFMAEVCRKCIREAGEHQELFDYLLQVLQWLDRSEKPIANLHLHFLLGLAGHLGFQPQETDEDARYFDLKEGLFSAGIPAHTQYLREMESAQVRALLLLPLEDAHELPLERSQRKLLLKQLLLYYQLHVPGFSGINTPEVLENIF
ncbi:MAG: DNA repair protein RecO [Chitinophagales bacterium]|nr:DNA repair protein RecO [Chitinophagales bacterium]